MHIIWLPHESHAGMSLPTADLRVQPAGIWLCQESLRHILASPGYAPGTIVVNVTWMERGFNACQTHRSMYPSIFNRFLVIQPVSSNVRHFSTFFCIKMHLALLLYSHFFGEKYYMWYSVLFLVFHYLLVDACLGLNWLWDSFWSHGNKVHSFIHSFIRTALYKYCVTLPERCFLRMHILCNTMFCVICGWAMVLAVSNFMPLLTSPVTCVHDMLCVSPLP